MKKKGFTLAEALVALGVIGVVAAILIPQLALGVQKKQAGAILAKAYTQIEQGMQNYVQAYNDTSADGSFVEKWTEIPNKDIKVLMTYSGVKPVDISGTGEAYRFNKLPVEFILTGSNVPYDIEIDINGIKKKPNISSVDRFKFVLTNEGKLEPYGKKDWRTKCGTTITDKNYCAARVIADGWKITY